MDVTSQLNLEREAGMGENTERRPPEPASAGRAAAVAEPRPAGAEGSRPAPGEDKPLPLSPPPGCQPLQPSGALAGSCPEPPAPSNTRYFASLRKTTHLKNNKPKTTDKPSSQMF